MHLKNASIYRDASGMPAFFNFFYFNSLKIFSRA